MKRTDLEKNIGKKISNRIRNEGGASVFSNDSSQIVDKREQRKIDQSLGLVPFAIKINIDLVQRIQDMAKERNTGVSEVVTELLQKGLSQ